MLRLDPAHPPVWRSATCLQFGLDDAARLDDPQPWELRLLAHLVRGLTMHDVHALLRAEGVAPERADALFAELQPVLETVPEASRVRVRVAGEVDPRFVHAAMDALDHAGVDAARDADPDPDADADADDPVLLLAAHLVAPHVAAALVSRGVRHVPVVLDATGARVGPVVAPGSTACLACLSAHARDADPAWPTLITQLVGRPCPLPVEIAAEAARAAVHLLSEADAATSRSVRIDARSPSRRWQLHRPHAECWCRSHGGSATAPVPLVRAPAPSSPRAFARPA